jgi:hypothetical protein
VPSAPRQVACPTQAEETAAILGLRGAVEGAERSSAEELHLSQPAKCQKVLSGDAEDCQIAPLEVTIKRLEAISQMVDTQHNFRR